MSAPCYRIIAPEGPVRSEVRLPLSKSVSARLLIIHALAGEPLKDLIVADADDTLTLKRLLHDRPQEMYCGMGGTTLRFLLAWCTCQPGERYRLIGDERLMSRPIEPLVDALRSLSACVEWSRSGWSVDGKELRGGTVELDASQSSQFTSALMMIGPMLDKGLMIRLIGNKVSLPYLLMTKRLMELNGAAVTWSDDLISIASGGYVSMGSVVPPDWSAASFWYQIVALSGDAKVLLNGLRPDGLQGDQCAMDLWAPWVRSDISDAGILLTRTEGRPVSRSIDLQEQPDLFIPLAFTHAAKGLSTEFTGLDTLRGKESDRLDAMRQVLISCGIRSEATDDTFRLLGDRSTLPQELLPTFGDHRMAMGIAPLALLNGPVLVRDPNVVSKSYASFWDDLGQVGFDVQPIA